MKRSPSNPNPNSSPNPFFLYRKTFQIEGETYPYQDLLKYLDPFLTENRKQRIQKISEKRLFSVCVVLEDIYDLGNAHAVWRTAEALGIHCVHHIQTAAAPLSHRNRSGRVSQGADNWLHIQHWPNTSTCLQNLQEQGYQIGLTSLDVEPESKIRDLMEVDFQKPTALVFGNEHRGISREAKDFGDISIKIPLYGFVQSYNLSVAAAISLYRARSQWPPEGDLQPSEQKILQAFFYTRALKPARCSQILESYK